MNGKVAVSSPIDQMTPSFCQPLKSLINEVKTKEGELRGAKQIKVIIIVGKKTKWQIPPKISTGAKSLRA